MSLGFSALSSGFRGVVADFISALLAPGFSVTMIPAIQVSQEAGDFFALESAVTPLRDAICPYLPVVTPAPQRVGMDMEEPGYLPQREHVAHPLFTSRIFSHLFLD